MRSNLRSTKRGRRSRKPKSKHTDAASWSQAGVAIALWTIATTAVTVFRILADCTEDALASLHASLERILVSDRAKVLGFWAMERR